MSGPSAYHPVGIIQRMVNDSHTGPQGFRDGGFTFVILIVRSELQLVDGVAEIMSNALFPQVRNQLIDVLVV